MFLGCESDAPVELGGGLLLASPEEEDRSWLFTGRVTPPARPPHYFRRTELVKALEKGRIALLMAPAGFGKTSLLADVCRRQRGQGTLSAWLTLADDDAPEVLAAYLLHSFERAGLNVSVQTPQEQPGASVPAERAVMALTRAIEFHAAPCLLVLDEVERLPAGPPVELVNTLLRFRPPNLHLAVAGRRNPGLDLQDEILAGRATRFGAEELRFSSAEIARFFSLDLPPVTVRQLAKRTEGWPVALQLYRNLGVGERRSVPVSDLRGDRGVAANFLGVRLLRGLSPGDREFVLDLGLFDWIDPELVDEVLGVSNSRVRLENTPELDGLLLPIEGGSGVRRFHPLLRDYCAARRLREDRSRFRTLHHAIARALAHRGHPLPAVRHARAAGDDQLVGEILEHAGAVRLFFAEGILRLSAIDSYLTPAVVSAHPRLGLLRCLALVFEGKVPEANALFAELRGRTRDFTQDRVGGDARRLYAESVLLEGQLAFFGCMRMGASAMAALTAKVAAVADDEANGPAVRGACYTLLAAANHQRAQFTANRRHSRLGTESYRSCNAQHGIARAELHAGIAAMAQGRTVEAADCYARARRTVKRRFPGETATAIFADALTAELSLERNRLRGADRLAPEPASVRQTGAWLDVYAATYDVATERTLARQGAADALTLLHEANVHARNLGLASLERHLAALQVSVLAGERDTQAAGQVWSDAALPETTPEILDLSGQTWREMEAVACARIRWLTALGSLDDARTLAHGLRETAAQKGLARTLMRGLAAAMVVEHEAGNPERAAEFVREFLARLPGTDYPRALVRESPVSGFLLRRLLEAAVPPRIRSAAEAVLAHLADDKAESFAGPAFTPRELEVLQLLAGGARDREIAAVLGLSANGVRYHLKNIYRKTRAKSRGDAVRHARSLGVVP